METKYKFIKTMTSIDGGPMETVIHITHSVSLGEIINDFEYFLRGAGFHFNGGLGVVEDDKSDHKT